MIWLAGTNRAKRHVTEAERLLRRFSLTASAEGVLRIRLAGPTLSYDELDTILDRISAERVDQRVTEVVLDLGMIELVEAPWTAVLALLIAFARRARSRCRVTGLHGQPASLLELYGKNRVIRALLHLDEPVGEVASAGGDRTPAQVREGMRCVVVVENRHLTRGAEACGKQRAPAARRHGKASNQSSLAKIHRRQEGG